MHLRDSMIAHFLMLIMQSLDVDECKAEDKGGCTQTCENLPGLYKCSCLPGYVLDDDKKTCIGKTWKK